MASTRAGKTQQWDQEAGRAHLHLNEKCREEKQKAGPDYKPSGPIPSDRLGRRTCKAPLPADATEAVLEVADVTEIQECS